MPKEISPHVEIYTGLDGYTRAMLRRIENENSPIKQIVNGTSVAVFHQLTDQLVTDVIAQRSTKGLAIKNLIRQEDKHLQIELSSPSTLKETRLLPSGFDLNIMFAVFGDTVTLTSLVKDRPFGIIITDTTIAQAFHVIFDHLWSSSTPI